MHKQRVRESVEVCEGASDKASETITVVLMKTMMRVRMMMITRLR